MLIFMKKLFINELKRTRNRVKLKFLINLANFLSGGEKKFATKNIKYLDLAVLTRKKVLPEIKTKTYLPNYTLIDDDAYIEVISPEVELVEFKDYTISGSCSGFINGNDLFIERYCNEENENAIYNSGSILSHDSRFSLIIESNITTVVDSGFFLIGNGSWNYYHWVIEILPKLQVYLELGLYKKNVKLLVSDSVSGNENFKFLLDSILGDIKVDIIFVSAVFSLKVKHLYHLTPINNLIFNEKVIGLTKNILHLRYESLSFVTSKIESAIASSNNEIFCADRIFLARKMKGVREYNQSDIIPLLLIYNFKIIYMEDHNIEQQILLFKNAKYIVGASGAAWTNLIFCNSSCRALTWLPESAKNFPVFSTLAKFTDASLFFFSTESSHYEDLHDKYIIDLGLFEKNLKELLK